MLIIEDLDNYLPRVQHLLLNFGGVGAPRHQEQLLFLARLRRALALVRVFKIEEAISGAQNKSHLSYFLDEFRNLREFYGSSKKIWNSLGDKFAEKLANCASDSRQEGALRIYR